MKKQMKAPSKPVAKAPFSRRFAVDGVRDKPARVRVEADAGERQALAAFLRLPGMSALSADIEIAPPSGGRFSVSGALRATITQTCVVSLEDFESDVTEAVQAEFAPEKPQKAQTGRIAVDVSPDVESDPPEPIIDGAIDLGALVAEFLALALDPYPRKPEAAFGVLRDAKDEDDPSPFAVLARLKRDGDKL